MKTQNILGEVGLNVKDLDTSLDYYTRILGLNIIEQTATTARLGVDNTSIIALTQHSDYTLPNTAYTGLYHIAILLPSEEDLGQILYHFAHENYAIDGAGDHIYSQALYMHDPDGNGIEIYADRPRETWIINEDNTIETGTNPVDIEALVNLVKHVEWHGLPTGTILGHIHLQVKDLKAHHAFYVDTLGFDLKTNWGNTALFISKNNYHHHIGANTWARPTQKRPETTTGLDYFTVYVENIHHVERALNQTASNNTLTITDPNGIRLHIIQA